ncbi:uncharacterized protein LOC134265909, partial [Saccostrea cucullata]|uniref:uncharacterized protein LOC134265909 n=1 Tax=Saccostrea cuccullata TaxID=36930 RepID=UPI002ED42C23
KAEDVLQKRFFPPLYQMHFWSPWSGCSSACGPGVYVRYRGCRIGFKEVPVCPYYGHEEWPCYGHYCTTRHESKPLNNHQHQTNDKRTTHRYVTSPKIFPTQVTVDQQHLPISHQLVQNGMATPSVPSPSLPSLMISNQTSGGFATPPPPISSMINGKLKPQNGTIAQSTGFPLIYPIINGNLGVHYGNMSPLPLTSRNQIKQLTPPTPSSLLPAIINGNQVIQITPSQMTPPSPTPKKVAVTLLFPSQAPALVNKSTVWRTTVLPKSTIKQWITIPRIK